MLLSPLPGTHCTTPTDPPDGSNLALSSWNSSAVPLGATVPYVCRDGMKFRDDFSKTEITLKCEEGNAFEAFPAGAACAPSENTIEYRG